jgi:hypothetical protein
MGLAYTLFLGGWQGKNRPIMYDYQLRLARNTGEACA